MGSGRSKEYDDFKKVNIDYVPENMRMSPVYEIIPQHGEIICQLRKTDIISITSDPYIFLKNFKEILGYLNYCQENMNGISERELWNNSKIIENCSYFLSNPEVFSYRVFEGIIQIRADISMLYSDFLSIVITFNQVIHLNNGADSYSNKISQREITKAIVLIINIYKNVIRERKSLIKCGYR